MKRKFSRLKSLRQIVHNLFQNTRNKFGKGDITSYLSGVERVRVKKLKSVKILKMQNTNTSTQVKIGTTFQYGNQSQTVIKFKEDGRVIVFISVAGRKCELSQLQFESNYYGFITNVKY